MAVVVIYCIYPRIFLAISCLALHLRLPLIYLAISYLLSLRYYHTMRGVFVITHQKTALFFYLCECIIDARVALLGQMPRRWGRQRPVDRIHSQKWASY